MNKVVDFTFIHLWIDSLMVYGVATKQAYKEGYEDAQLYVAEEILRNNPGSDKELLTILDTIVSDQRDKTFPYVDRELGYNDAIKDLAKLLEEAKAQ